MKFDNIDNGRGFDFGKTAESYAKYRDIYPEELYCRLHEIGVGRKNSRLLDLGTGTGVLPKNMARFGAKITGVDISPEQISYAKRYSDEKDLGINYIAADAASLDFPENSFDSVTAAQCFWYFDKGKVLPFIKKVTVDGGIFAKVYMTYLLSDEIAARSHELVKRMNKNWTPEASGSADMYDDCFPGRKTEKFDCDIEFTRESWLGRMTACRGTLASMDNETFLKWKDEEMTLLSAYSEMFSIRHRVIISYFIIDKRI